MKIYYPKITYRKAERAHIFPLLKPFIKPGEFNDEQRQTLYGISEQDVSFVDTLEQAEIVVLPMSWNYYVKNNQVRFATQFIKNAAKLNKKVWVTMLSDVGLKFPNFKNVIVFRASGYRSKLPNWHQAIPIFITDPLEGFFSKSKPTHREYSNNPTIGFCGLASNSKWNAFKIKTRILLKNLGGYINLFPNTSEELLSAPNFRYQILELLKNQDGITNNFIVRSQYRAGSVTKEQRKKSTLEFYNNIIESDYVLCARGAGNFSARLFETLAMGRIPIYINTDGLLPLLDTIDWKKHVVWIEKNEIPIITEKVIAFHQNLNEVKLNQLFETNRALWENKFQMGLFFKNYFYEY
jgi:hypothetical protein